MGMMVYGLVILATVAADQFSKMLVVASLALYQSVEVIPGFFNLVHVTNTGAAFSLLADFDSPWRNIFFLSVGTVAVIAMTVASYKLAGVSRLYPLALGLISGGAIGNLIDRVRIGAVIDFLDFYLGRYHWPAFNVADSAICVGAVVFIGVNLFEAKVQATKEQV